MFDFVWVLFNETNRVTVRLFARKISSTLHDTAVGSFVFVVFTCHKFTKDTLLRLVLGFVTRYIKTYTNEVRISLFLFVFPCRFLSGFCVTTYDI